MLLQDKLRLSYPHYRHYGSYAMFAEPLFRKCQSLKPYLVREAPCSARPLERLDAAGNGFPSVVSSPWR